MTDVRKTSASLAAHLGRIARQARTRDGLTQEDMAERMSLATEVYGRLERGNMLPSVPTLMRLCLVLRMEPNELLGFDTHHAPPWLGAYASAEANVSLEPPEVRRLLRALDELGPRQRTLCIRMAHLLMQSLRGHRSDGDPPKHSPS